jgi:hypothetical protein
MYRRLNHGGGAIADLGCYLIDFVNLNANGAQVTNVEKRFISNDQRNFSAIIEFDSTIIPH